MNINEKKIIFFFEFKKSVEISSGIFLEQFLYHLNRKEKNTVKHDLQAVDIEKFYRRYGVNIKPTTGNNSRKIHIHIQF